MELVEYIKIQKEYLKVNKSVRDQLWLERLKVSMTQLLTHSVAHSTNLRKEKRSLIGKFLLGAMPQLTYYRYKKRGKCLMGVLKSIFNMKRT